MSSLSHNVCSGLASDIIRKKLLENGGRAVVSSARGNQYEIRASRDGAHFECNELPIKPPYELLIFDVMVECMVKNGNKARKGNGRNYKLGASECDDTTIVGYIGKHYARKPSGSSVFDPVFVLVPILEWAEIAYNDKGMVYLTASYLKAIQDAH